MANDFFRRMVQAQTDKAVERNQLLQQLCLASYHLLKGADAIYDPRGDTGPTHWLKTRDQLLDAIGQALQLSKRPEPVSNFIFRE